MGAHTFKDFWRYVKKTKTCWLWTGQLREGYGRFKMRGKYYTAHRISYELIHGNVKAYIKICHSCDVRNCVNPAHLFAGSDQTNTDDKVAKGRQSCLKGEDNPSALLNEIKVKQVRKMYATGNYFQVDLAKFFGVANSTINAIITQRTWRHI